MGITLIIVGGLVLLTAVAGAFDYLGKRAKTPDRSMAARIEGLEARIGSLETRSLDKDERIAKLESELTFVNRLLVDGREGKGPEA
jgi:hypothetical protein